MAARKSQYTAHTNRSHCRATEGGLLLQPKTALRHASKGLPGGKMVGVAVQMSTQESPQPSLTAATAATAGSPKGDERARDVMVRRKCAAHSAAPDAIVVARHATRELRTPKTVTCSFALFRLCVRTNRKGTESRSGATRLTGEKKEEPS